MSSIKITLEDLFDIPTAVIYTPDDYKPVTSVTIDSRNVPANSIFVALKGERLNGHKFVFDAVKNGAKAVIINSTKYKNFESVKVPIITVEDTTKALGDLAKIWRSKLSTKIISLTGSSGKTTTKEMLAVILSEKFNVNKTLANNNNHIGVPLTIFSTNNKHEVLICEHGTNHFGEIKYTAEIANPDYAVITNIGTSHIEFLKNKNGVLKEKSALFNVAEKHNGLIFINNDDKHLSKIKNKYSKTITYGFDKTSDILAEIINYDQEAKPELKINFKNKNIKVKLPVPGDQNAFNFLAAIAIALKLGLTKQQILAGVKKFKAVDKRINIRKKKNYTIIDDTYNANPDSMKYSLELMKKMNTSKKKIAVLGDMLELGKDSEKLHRQIAKEIKKNMIDEVYSIGKNMKLTDEELNKTKIEHIHFKRRDLLKKKLQQINLTNSIILFKGSRGMKMEEFVRVIESGNSK